ncbi:hypothetical protein MEO93_15495, partial [Dolichospermum sp. ST_sed3]|nr:hypothetical protein [Dolichospermum sp. ST_sed3]
YCRVGIAHNIRVLVGNAKYCRVGNAHSIRVLVGISKYCRVGNAHSIRVLVGNAHPTYMYGYATQAIKNQIGVLYL